jgi:hypothetical protein
MWRAITPDPARSLEPALIVGERAQSQVWILSRAPWFAALDVDHCLCSAASSKAFQFENEEA